MKKRIILTALSFAVFLSLKAQLQTQVVGDSILLHGNNGNAELILENRSRNVRGFLYNKWDGRTEFRKVMTRLNDSTYVFGEDTLRIKNSGGSVDLTFRNGLRRIDNTVEWGADTLNVYGPNYLSRPTVLYQASQPFQWITGNNQFHVTNSPYTPYNSSPTLSYYTPFRVSHNSQGFMYLENNYSMTSGWNGPSFGILFGNRHPAARKFPYYNQMITANIVVESLGTWSNDIDISQLHFGVAGDTLAGDAASITGAGPAKYGLVKLPTLAANHRLAIGEVHQYSGAPQNFLYTRFYANARNVPFVWKDLPWDEVNKADTVLSIDYDGNVRRKVLSGGGGNLLSAATTLDFPLTNSASSSDLTLAVVGAEDGDAVSLGVPHGSTQPNSQYSAWVSATGVVTVRFNNYGSAAIDPAAGTFKVKVLK